MKAEKYTTPELYIIEFVQPEYTEDLVKKPRDNTKVYNKNLN